MNRSPVRSKGTILFCQENQRYLSSFFEGELTFFNNFITASVLTEEKAKSVKFRFDSFSKFRGSIPTCSVRSANLPWANFGFVFAGETYEAGVCFGGGGKEKVTDTILECRSVGELPPSAAKRIKLGKRCG